MSDDPFEDLDPDDYRDREGNPFDAFGEDEDTHGELDEHEDEDKEDEADRPEFPVDVDSVTESRGSEPSEDPFEYLGGGDDEMSQSAGTASEGETSVAGGEQSVDVSGDAFGDVDVSRGDPFESADSPFRQVDVERVDPDEVWERFTGEAERAETDRNGALGGEEIPEDAADVVEVPKGRFCQTCPHFSAPPETACSHPGTELLTFVGSDEVRVSNCPVVGERRELGETYD